VALADLRSFGIVAAPSVPGSLAQCRFMGAMLGSAFGQLAHTALPHLTAPAGAYALVGMGAVFAGGRKVVGWVDHRDIPRAHHLERERLTPTNGTNQR
jgi:hypothetical protein